MAKPAGTCYETLLRYGLTPEDVCVDYGCGTLRIGIHVIGLLPPGAYWGLDITKPLLDKSRELLGEVLLAEKRPHLKLITPDNVAEVAAHKPSFVFSAKVLQHVHPDEVEEYFANILSMIGSWGRALISCQFSPDETLQYGGSGWAHGFPGIKDIVARLGGKVKLLAHKQGAREGARDARKRRGEFMIVAKDAPWPMLPPAPEPSPGDSSRPTSMTLAVSAERDGRALAQSQVEITNKGDLRNFDKAASKALGKFLDEHPEVGPFDGTLRIKFARLA